jgi:hypothetical protein
MGSCRCQVGEDGEFRSQEGDSRGDTFVGYDATNEAKVSLAAATKGGAYGLAVCLAFSF